MNHDIDSVTIVFVVIHLIFLSFRFTIQDKTKREATS